MTPQDERAKACWEFWDCPSKFRDNCIVYKTDSGDKCWLLVNKNGNIKCVASYKNCQECSWYKRNNK